MGAKVNKMLNMLGFGSDEGYEDEYDNTELDYDSASYDNAFDRFRERRSSKVVKLQDNPTQLRVVVVQPNTFDEAKDITNHLKQDKPVVVNLESVDGALAHRIFDFLCGAVYTLDGSIQKISNRIFIIAPENVEIMTDEIKTDSKGAFIWN